MEISFEHFSLAPIQQKDAWRLCNFVTANETYLKDDFPETLKENATPNLAELFVAKKEKAFLNKEEYLFTLKENSERTIIGLVFVKELHKKEGQAEIAYCLSYSYTGKGVMTKAVQKIIDWAFTIGKLDRVQLLIHESNKASLKIADKLQFSYITVLQKEHRRSNGEIVDMQLFELNKNSSKKT